MNYNSVTVKGHDYSKPLRDMLPTIIGKRAKSAMQIAKKAGRQQQSVRVVLERLHGSGQVHIKRWTRGKAGPYVPNYIWGPGVDEIKPTPVTNTEKIKKYRATPNGKAVCAACRERWSKSEKGKDYRSSYSKARWARDKFSSGGVAAIDPLLAALMGSSNKPQTTKE